MAAARSVPPSFLPGFNAADTPWTFLTPILERMGSIAPATRERVRFVMGMLQMFGAVTGLVLLALTGLNAATIIAVAATTSLTLISRTVFRRRS